MQRERERDRDDARKSDRNYRADEGEERERDGVDCLTGGHAESTANMSLKVRGRDPGVIKSVVHMLQLHGQTQQGNLHFKQIRMYPRNTAKTTPLTSAVV